MGADRLVRVHPASAYHPAVHVRDGAAPIESVIRASMLD